MFTYLFYYYKYLNGWLEIFQLVKQYKWQSNGEIIERVFGT